MPATSTFDQIDGSDCSQRASRLLRLTRALAAGEVGGHVTGPGERRPPATPPGRRASEQLDGNDRGQVKRRVACSGTDWGIEFSRGQVFFTSSHKFVRCSYIVKIATTHCRIGGPPASTRCRQSRLIASPGCAHFHLPATTGATADRRLEWSTRSRAFVTPFEDRLKGVCTPEVDGYVGRGLVVRPGERSATKNTRGQSNRPRHVLGSGCGVRQP